MTKPPEQTFKQKLSSFVDGIKTAPETQIDPIIKERVKNLSNMSQKDGKEILLDIIGDCINYSMCSSFALKLLQIMYVEVYDGDILECTGSIRSVKISHES
jgi:hypothetical protein